tara:strand:+ start:176 stop:1612 length:1437 start_codon:yes stop_codon:yes gene_type:complete
MAIKLADVIERTNTAYPVIEAHDKTIVGLYNGASANAQLSLELHYVSQVKTGITTDGQAATAIQFTDSYTTGALTNGQVSATTSNALLTAEGGILTVLDQSLKSDAGSFPSPHYAGAYLAQVVPGGGNTDTNRNLISRFSELIQQFNRYPTLDGSSAITLADTAGEDLLFGVYSTEQQRMRAMTIQEVVAAIAVQLNTDVVASGLITTAQASGSGGFADLNGDGLVNSADLLAFLTSFGASQGYETNYRVLVGAQSVSNIDVGVSPADLGTFALSDLSTFDYPSSPNIAGEAFGFSTVQVSTGAANLIKLNDMALGGAGAPLINSHWINRNLKVKFETTVHFDAPDVLYALVHVKLTSAGAPVINEEVMIVSGGTQDYETNSMGFYSLGYYGTEGGAFLAQDVPWSGTVNFKPEGFPSRYPVADNYVNHDTDLEAGFNMGYEFSDTTNINDVEIRVHFVSVNNAVTVDVDLIQILIEP